MAVRGGIWCLPKPVLDKIRHAIVENGIDAKTLLKTEARLVGLRE
jgi:hypothetical protein